MSGVWVGDWGHDEQTRNRVVVVLDWMGSELSGTINPGPNAVAVRAAAVNPEDWSLHLEADAQDSAGQAVTWIIDGTIDDLGTYNRSIAGTWLVNDIAGTFSITRQ